MVRSVFATRRRVPVEVVVIVDDDDPKAEEYLRLLPGRVRLLTERIGYSASLNLVARELLGDPRNLVFGAFGDDVLFRTEGWDRLVARALARPGIAYGNDLVHAAGHPTAVWMSREIVEALGWLALPTSWHLWVDDAWKRLGQETGTLRYLPNVVVEHMHPAVGKADMDETYREVYDADRGHRDHLAFLAWEESGLAGDAAKVRMALSKFSREFRRA
jgi:hypothetical protein